MLLAKYPDDLDVLNQAGVLRSDLPNIISHIRALGNMAIQITRGICWTACDEIARCATGDDSKHYESLTARM